MQPESPEGYYTLIPFSSLKAVVRHADSPRCDGVDDTDDDFAVCVSAVAAAAAAADSGDDDDVDDDDEHGDGGRWQQ